MVVVVVNESLDSAVERSSVFLWQDVNILIFYCFPKPFDPDIVFSSTAAGHVAAGDLIDRLKWSQKATVPHQIGQNDVGRYLLLFNSDNSVGITLNRNLRE